MEIRITIPKLKDYYMKRWQKFEIDSTNYLSEKYKDKTFKNRGGSDSTESDIKVNDDYYIEAKLCPAQCCQFVLFPEDNQFIYSQHNKKPINQHSKKIIEHMNQNFEFYADKNINSKPIVYDKCEKDFFNCIKEFYSYKNVKYFITNGFLLVPKDEIEKVFTISAKYRVKKSGSKNPNKSMVNSLSEIINKNYQVKSINYKNDSLIIESNDNLNKVKFDYMNNTYMFSESNGIYKLRQLSKTCNSNVIFSINLKK